MFSIENITENGFDKVILKEGKNCSAEIVPSCSAILHAFRVNFRGEQVNVIESYASREDFGNNVANKGFLGTKLSPFVCRINNGKYHFEGRELTIEKYYDRGNALHGLLYDKPFRVVFHESDTEHAAVSMVHEYRAMDHGYPFHYDCVVKYTLKKENVLIIATEVINRDEVLIPLQDGWHPYFTLGAPIDQLELQFHAAALIEFDERLIPTGKKTVYSEFKQARRLGDTFFDHCFLLDHDKEQPLCFICNPQTNLKVEIMPDPSYSYLQLYTPAHRHSIAIENISGAPDAFNNGMGVIHLAPGNSAIFTTTYKISY